MCKLSIKDVRTPLKIKITNKNLCIFDIWQLLKHSDDYVFDFNVFLPSKGMNLQRGNVWTLEQKQEFIFSLIKEVKIPPISVIHRDHKVIYVIDGKQRLTCILDFIHNLFPIEVKGLQYYFEDFNDDLMSMFLRISILGDVAYEYSDSPELFYSDDDKIQWFNLINFSQTPQDKAHLRKLLGEGTESSNLV